MPIPNPGPNELLIRVVAGGTNPKDWKFPECLMLQNHSHISQNLGNARIKITAELIEAADCAGFFTLIDHGISKEEIEAQFSVSKAFFDLPRSTKGKITYNHKTNNGWEYKTILGTKSNVPFFITTQEVKQAVRLGYKGFALTVNAVRAGKRERDLRVSMSQRSPKGTNPDDDDEEADGFAGEPSVGRP
ncbi:non-heme dioxygenase in morphine synthesis N-terminal [Aspergillus parasiticus SU-1]|uniref:Non-heme dioxygenase in morphine synthesis N-terminal n=1 Tax=Aspergillus parasiticus (strain ATCC 56775 / NRRL 5862 / SRRC 143 / SU-1) TaxID=1403190 RepID=A0A0F0IGL9_ASPPU|nr:non-heme dioxygenase in morphine synthesis N-terminal [Aspergillus parasiticus SU-1]